MEGRKEGEGEIRRLGREDSMRRVDMEGLTVMLRLACMQSAPQMPREGRIWGKRDGSVCLNYLLYEIPYLICGARFYFQVPCNGFT